MFEKTNLPRRFRFMSLLLSTTIAAALIPWTTQSIRAEVGISIAVDGEYVAGDVRDTEEPRSTDVGLANADIQVTYDGLEAEPRLATGLLDARINGDGTKLTFGINMNYARWVERAEVRVFGQGTDTPLAIIPFDNGRAEWTAAAVDGDLLYVARVYDRDGRYDETLVQTIDLAAALESAERSTSAFFGRDQTAFRNIPVAGGTITVHGTNVPEGAHVGVLGKTVPVDNSGSFVSSTILPSGDHVVDISVVPRTGSAVVFRRDVNIPTSEWYYVGFADLTVGTRWGEGRIVDASPDEFDGIYHKGRVAFYLKGKIKGEYLLTASGDTGEGSLSEMLSGGLSTDPQALLRRIDPNQYYPVYGDDSVLVDDAPTSGKLYVRLERGPSHILWGNFRTEIGDSSMLRTQRTLYGASAHFESDGVTENGDPRLLGTAYFAKPGTLPATDVLRGTGGSAYVLRRQDIVPGSETVTIEVVNAVTGVVTQVRSLRPVTDYSINYMQGLIILAEPLASTQPSTGAVQSSQADYINLSVQYEYTPTGQDPEDYVFGASGSVWVNNHLRIGTVAMSETDAQGEDVSVVGINVRAEAGSNSFVEAELLRSAGQGRSEWLSTDGGFTYVQSPDAKPVGEAYAYRLRAEADLSDLIDETFAVVGGITLEGREAGFSTLGQQTRYDTFSASAYVDIGLTPILDFGFEVDHMENAVGTQETEVAGELLYRLNDDLTITSGILHRKTAKAGGTTADNGHRTDLGMRVEYQITDALAFTAFGQVTVQATEDYERNDRIGLGADWQINEEWSVGAEGSVGTTGPQVLAMVSHTTAPGERTYLGFRVAPDVQDDFFDQSTPLNGVVAGVERHLNEAVSVYIENSYGLYSDDGRSTALYGVNYDPGDAWSTAATYETGHIEDASGDFERHALSASVGYLSDSVEWSARGEVRIEDSYDNSKDRNTFLGRSSLSVQTSADWRVLAGASALLSQSDQSSILDGNYVEATIGGAYRPVSNDRLNALIRYTYLYDLPGPDQVLSSGSTMGPAQRSHIFSVDANYDINEHITIGGKYGFRIGEISETRSAEDFKRSSVHLLVLRADFSLFEDWHLLLEGRGLYQPETDTLDTGTLAMVSYDVNEAVRIGLGYNFGRFSDDLRDVTLDDHGVFLNMSARF